MYSVPPLSSQNQYCVNIEYIIWQKERAWLAMEHR